MDMYERGIKQAMFKSYVIHQEDACSKERFDILKKNKKWKLHLNKFFSFVFDINLMS